MANCINGHDLPMGAAFCPTCGYVVKPMTDAEATTDLAAPVPPPSRPSRSPRMSKTAWLVTAVVVVVALIGGGVSIAVALTGSKPKTDTIRFVFEDFKSTCASELSDDGTTNGTSVTIKGDSGTQVAAGALGDGTDGTASLTDGTTVDTCTRTSTINVPDGPTTYTFYVGSGTSGITFSRQELVANAWEADMSFYCPSNIADNAC